MTPERLDFDGELQELHSPRQASALGIEVVYQDLALCENLDIVSKYVFWVARPSSLEP